MTNKEFLQKLLTTITSSKHRLELRMGRKNLIVFEDNRIGYIVCDNDTGEILYNMGAGPKDLIISDWCNKKYK
jgi:hypothetical protein